MAKHWKQLSTLVGIMFLAGIVWAYTGKGKDGNKVEEIQNLAKEAKVSMATALDTAIKLVPGTVIKAELEKENEVVVYSFEILPTPESEIIKEVTIDASSGKVVKQEDEKLDENKAEDKEDSENSKDEEEND